MDLSELEIEELGKIYRDKRVDKERFRKGINFVQKVLSGQDKVSAYYDLFEERNKNKAWNLWRAKWVQEIVKVLKIDNKDNFQGLANLVVQSAIDILNNPLATPSERMASAKLLQPYALLEEEQKEKEKENVYVINLIEQIRVITQKSQLIEGVIIE